MILILRCHSHSPFQNGDEVPMGPIQCDRTAGHVGDHLARKVDGAGRRRGKRERDRTWTEVQCREAYPRADHSDASNWEPADTSRPQEPPPAQPRFRLTEEQLRALESLDLGEAFGPLWRSLTAEVRVSWAERDALRRRLP